MFNRVTLIGRLGADPEVRNTQTGNSVANLRVATSEFWKDKNTGERKERTEWHAVVIWNENLVKVAENYLKKGSLVLVEGKLQTRKWEKNGEDRYTTEVVLQGFDCKLQMLGGKNDNGGQGDGDDDEPRQRNNGKSRDSESSQRRSRDRDDEPRQRDQRGGRAFDDEIPF